MFFYRKAVTCLQPLFHFILDACAILVRSHHIESSQLISDLKFEMV